MIPNEISALEDRIRTAAQKYYTDGSSDLTDEEFDTLVDTLRQIHPQSDVLKTGWGYSTWLDSTPGEKVEHIYGEVGSLNKCRTYSEVNNIFKLEGEAKASLKLDGISVVLHYNSGKFYKAVTRGDGQIGIDITDKVKQILPPSDQQLRDDTFTGAVRGEIVMLNSMFEKYKKLRPDVKNPRNTTAGMINSKSVSEDLKYLKIFVYSIIGDESTKYESGRESRSTIYKVYNWLETNFTNVARHTKIAVSSEESFISSMHGLKDIWYDDVPADGIVITAPTTVFSPTDNSIMYVAQAFKFKSEVAEARVTNIEWNLSKTRYLIPKVNIETVQLAGTNVSNCTGYNAKYILDNSVNVGSVVEVEKRGEIIPNINKVIVPVKAELPTICPSCGEELIWSGVHLACPNEMCNNATAQDLSVWLQQLAPVDGLGDSIKFKFLERIYGKDLSIEIVMSKSDSVVFFMGGRSGHKQLISSMMHQLFKRVDIPLKDAILALNIPRLGSVNAEKLSQHPNMVKVLADGESSEVFNSTVFWSDLADSIGAANAQSVKDNAWKFGRLRFISDRIAWSSAEHISVSKGKVAITGKLSVKRADFEAEIKAAGYHPAEISKDTLFLITDDPNSSSSKNKKADQWGVTKITEAEFRQKYLFNI